MGLFAAVAAWLKKNIPVRVDSDLKAMRCLCHFVPLFLAIMVI
jgi:hypothetical protein